MAIRIIAHDPTFANPCRKAMTTVPIPPTSAQADRTRLEAEVALRTGQLRELALHLETAREDERSRLARDLHDELGALLTSAKLDAARIRARLGTTAPEAQERLTHLVSTLDSVIALKRQIIENLRPSALSHLGLVVTLQILARETSESSGLPIHCALCPVDLAPAAELVAFRCVQEALTNISKHAHARQVWIDLAAGNGCVELSIRDDGVGFDPSAPGAAAYGLLGMRFRVEAEGGELHVESATGRGTCIRLTLPPASRQVARAGSD
jgi:signal transduction histidine kinase